MHARCSQTPAGGTSRGAACAPVTQSASVGEGPLSAGVDMRGRRRECTGWGSARSTRFQRRGQCGCGMGSRSSKDLGSDGGCVWQTRAGQNRWFRMQAAWSVVGEGARFVGGAGRGKRAASRFLWPASSEGAGRVVWESVPEGRQGQSLLEPTAAWCRGGRLRRTTRETQDARRLCLFAMRMGRTADGQWTDAGLATGLDVRWIVSQAGNRGAIPARDSGDRNGRPCWSWFKREDVLAQLYAERWIEWVTLGWGRTESDRIHGCLRRRTERAERERERRRGAVVARKKRGEAKLVKRMRGEGKDEDARREGRRRRRMTGDAWGMAEKKSEAQDRQRRAERSRFSSTPTPPGLTGTGSVRVSLARSLAARPQG